jgi:hypothetical protein
MCLLVGTFLPPLLETKKNAEKMHSVCVKKYFLTGFLIVCVILLGIASSCLRWPDSRADADAASIEIHAIQRLESALAYIASSPSSGQFSPNATQKFVISFSLYGTHEKYLNGALQNVDLAKLYYPGWTCHFYVAKNTDVPTAVLTQLQLKGAVVRRMQDDALITQTSCGFDILKTDAGRADAASSQLELGSDSAAWRMTGSALGMFWRLCVALDPSVDVFILRDVDSRINSRESSAVREWLVQPPSSAPKPPPSSPPEAAGAHTKGSIPSIGKLVHIMRDHPTHCSFTMLGGMWGAKRGAGLGPLVQETLASFARERGRGAAVWGTDQEYLHEHLWPVVRSRRLHHSHDSHCCEIFDDTFPFPVPRLRAQFVGQIYNAKHETKFDANALQPVPLSCRRHPSDTHG